MLKSMELSVEYFGGLSKYCDPEKDISCVRNCAIALQNSYQKVERRRDASSRRDMNKRLLFASQNFTVVF